MNIYILAQIIGIMAWLFFLSSYFGKRINKVILLQFISSILYCLNYLLLGAWSGFFVSTFEGLKELGYYKTDKDKYIFIITIPIYILIAFISEKSILMIIPIIASIIDGYGILKSRNTVVVCGVISNTIWIIYDLYYFNYAIAFSDFTIVFLNLCILFYGYNKFLHKNNVYTLNKKYISNKTLETIYNLDTEYYDVENCWNLDNLKKIYFKERDSYILIKDQNKIIGYINILSLKKETYEQINNSSVMLDNLNEDNIISYNNHKNYYLSINSIVLKNEYHNKDSINKIINSIKKFINKKEKQGYKIIKINSYTVNQFEQTIMEKLNFSKIKKISNECFLYEYINN